MVLAQSSIKLYLGITEFIAAWQWALYIDQLRIESWCAQYNILPIDAKNIFFTTYNNSYLMNIAKVVRVVMYLIPQDDLLIAKNILNYPRQPYSCFIQRCLNVQHTLHGRLRQWFWKYRRSFVSTPFVLVHHSWGDNRSQVKLVALCWKVEWPSWPLHWASFGCNKMFVDFALTVLSVALMKNYGRAKGLCFTDIYLWKKSWRKQIVISIVIDIISKLDRLQVWSRAVQ